MRTGGFSLEVETHVHGCRTNEFLMKWSLRAGGVKSEELMTADSAVPARYPGMSAWLDF